MSEKSKGSILPKKQESISRRRFLAGAGAAAFSFTIMKPALVRGTEANSKINLGLIGCGVRGVWIADLFQKHGGYNIAAAFDYFEDKTADCSDKLKVDHANCYNSSLSSYKKLLEQKNIDAVVIESPPCFHPEQAAAAVDAGKHVYVAKPVAVDVPGCNSIAESGKKASEKKHCFLVDFQTRTNPFYQEAIKRVQYGDIGKIFAGDVGYYTGRIGKRSESGTPEARLRNWPFYIALSGDIITEQNIHCIDVMTWILDAQPVRAYGSGGRSVRVDVGDCWDHFNVIFYFPNDVVINFGSKQCGEGFEAIIARMYGPYGTIFTDYCSNVSISGNYPYKGGNVGNIYTDGAMKNIATFHDNITKGLFQNPTVAPSVRSNLTTILGRTAAYNKREVTWDEMVKANEKIDLKLEGLKA